jgi:periplasmic protein CpxP/Spy
MDYIKKNKFLTAVVAILVLLNLSVVAFVFFFFKPPSLPLGPSARGERFRFVDERLNLSAEQKAKFKELRQQEFARMDSVVRVRAQEMKDLFSLLKKENASVGEIQWKASVIGALEAEQAEMMFKHFQALRALCNPDQQKEFDRLITDAMIQVRGGMGPQGPGFGGPGFGRPGFPPGGGPLPGGPPLDGSPDSQRGVGPQ